MAIWTYGKKILHGVDLVFLFDLGYGHNMVHVDETFSNVAVLLFK